MSIPPISGATPATPKVQVEYKNDQFNITLPDGTKKILKSLSGGGVKYNESDKKLNKELVESIKKLLVKEFSDKDLQKQAKTRNFVKDGNNDVQIRFKTVDTLKPPKPTLVKARASSTSSQEESPPSSASSKEGESKTRSQTPPLTIKPRSSSTISEEKKGLSRKDIEKFISYFVGGGDYDVEFQKKDFGDLNPRFINRLKEVLKAVLPKEASSTDAEVDTLTRTEISFLMGAIDRSEESIKKAFEEVLKGDTELRERYNDARKRFYEKEFSG